MVQAFRNLAARDRHKKHRVVDAPDRADILLFVDCHLSPDWRMRCLLDHRDLVQFRNRALVYNECDEPWVAAPGVYVSLPKRHFDERTARAWGYYTLGDETAPPEGCQPDLLFSFVGTPGHVTSEGHRVRRRILQLSHPSAHIEDSSGFVFFDGSRDPEAHRARQKHFAEMLGRSKLVLCPRGRGTSSIRLYEVMRAGRAPVILADQWVPPQGPDWDSFALRVAEADVARLPEMLENREKDWQALGAEARRAYEQWFAPDVAFHHIIEKCAEVLPVADGFAPDMRGGAYRELALKARKQRLRSIAGKALRRILPGRRS